VDPAADAGRQPDLQGVWINNSITPLERPTALAGRTHVSDDEVAQVRDRVARLVDNGNGDVLLPDQLFAAALANFSEPYKNPNATGAFSQGIAVMVDNRTSLITDPPDGKIPPLTTAAQARQAAVARAGFGIPLVSRDRQIPQFVYSSSTTSGATVSAGWSLYIELRQVPELQLRQLG
jgi:hypothetical protein